MSVSLKTIMTNVASQWMMQVGSILITFALIGYSVQYLGAEHYGGWAAIISIIGYLTMLDAGMTVAVQYNIARLAEKDAGKDITSFFSASLLVYSLAAVLAAFICYMLSTNYSDIFPKLSEVGAVQGAEALEWVAVAMILIFLSMPAQGALQGLQKHYIKNLIELVSLLSQFLAVILMFNIATPSLEHLGIAYCVGAAIRFVLCAVSVKFVYPALSFNFSKISKISLSNVFSYGGHSTLWTISSTLTRESGPFIAAITLGAREATYIYVGTRVVRAVGMFIQAAGSVFIPVATVLNESDSMKHIQRLVINGTQLFSMMAFFGMAMLLVFGDEVLYYWLGEDMLDAYGVLMVTAIGMSASWSTQIQQSVLMGIKILWPVTGMMVFRLITGIPLAFLLAQHWGSEGIAASLIIPMAFTSFLIIPLIICKKIKLEIYKLYRVMLIPLVTNVILGVAGYLLNFYWKPDTVYLLVLQCLIMSSMFMYIVYRYGLPKELKTRLMNIMK